MFHRLLNEVCLHIVSTVNGHRWRCVYMCVCRCVHCLSLEVYVCVCVHACVSASCPLLESCAHMCPLPIFRGIRMYTCVCTQVCPLSIVGCVHDTACARVLCTHVCPLSIIGGLCVCVYMCVHCPPFIILEVCARVCMQVNPLSIARPRCVCTSCSVSTIHCWMCVHVCVYACVSTVLGLRCMCVYTCMLDQ